jgi:hypothetical protein
MWVLVLGGRLVCMQLVVAVLACTAAAAWEPAVACTAVEENILRPVLPAGQPVHLQDPFGRFLPFVTWIVPS